MKSFPNTIREKGATIDSNREIQSKGENQVSGDGRLLLGAVGVVTKAPSSTNKVGITFRKKSAVGKI